MVNTVKEYNDLSIQNEIDNYVIYLSAFKLFLIQNLRMKQIIL
jgi:hypothetical protein